MARLKVQQCSYGLDNPILFSTHVKPLSVMERTYQKHNNVLQHYGLQLNMAAAAGTSLSADRGQPTSWGIFNIDDIGSAFAGFSYAYDAPVSNPPNPLVPDFELTESDSGCDKTTGVCHVFIIDHM